MNMILKISFRNIVRQKRRNFLLGSGVAFGVCILLIANAFSHGITDILFNKIIIKLSGHIVVTMIEKDTKEWRMIRDKERLKQIILENVEGVSDIRESVGKFGRAIGNGAASFIALTGIEPDNEFYQEIEVLEGDLTDLTNPEIEIPVAIYDQVAKDLNVTLHDVIRMRFETVYGQAQTAKLTVVAIMKSGNPFMNVITYTHLNKFKPLVECREHEAEDLLITLQGLKNPERVIEQANRLHEALQPNVAGYKGMISGNGNTLDIQAFAISPGDESRQPDHSQFQIIAGSLEETLNDEFTVLLSQSLANRLGVNIGDQVTSSYQTRFEGRSPDRSYRVGAMFQPNDEIRENMIFLHVDQFYEFLFASSPQDIAMIPRESRLFALLLKEWTLLERSPNQEALREKYFDLEDRGWRGRILDVRTMYEAVNGVIEIEKALDITTLIAVFILFFVILIGVVNTLRMTIRERTREIGTVRAIGMQRWDVRWTFVTEVVLLALFASIIGTGLAFLLMRLLALITFHSDESFFMVFLVNKHLHFVPTIADIVRNIAIIIGIAFITAFFPAGRAAKLSVAEALRHYE